MLAIAVNSPGGVIFIQKRAGKYNKPFRMLKFRSMYISAPADVATNRLVGADSYITPVGRFLRRTSLDELPQLWNILKGDMSFIGPRPVVLTETELLRLRREKEADRVRPGLTGLAQVRGRDTVDVERKARYDAYYARHACLRLDLSIALATIRIVKNGDGIREGAESVRHRRRRPKHIRFKY